MVEGAGSNQGVIIARNHKKQSPNGNTTKETQFLLLMIG